MNRADLYRSFSEIDDDILERSERATGSRASWIRRHVSVALIAARLCLFLMGAGVIAVIYGDNIQNWFGYYFSETTGHEMSQSQAELIDHLSQNIGQSQTIDGTTVTVDSVTMGDDSFFLLLRVEGAELSKRYGYDFDNVVLEVSPNPLTWEDGIGGYGTDFLGLDGDGAALFLIDHSYTTAEPFTTDTTPLEVHLVLNDFMRSPRTEKRKMITEGVWEFDFSIDRSKPPETVSLPDTQVTAQNLHTQEDGTVLLTDLVLTNTGIRFRYDYQDGTYDLAAHIQIQLKNGATIHYKEGSSILMDDKTTLNCSYHWQIPVELDEVQAVLFDDIAIPVS